MNKQPKAKQKQAWAATILVASVSTVMLAACASVEKPVDILETLKASFTERGPAKLDRLEQNEVQQVCSQADATGKAVDGKTRTRLEAVLYKNIPYPADEKYIGDWKLGEKIAQDGTGLQFSDKIGAPSGANCYACHQIAPQEISYGNIGPSLYKYGVNRGVKDPNSKDSLPIVQYTWARIWNTHSVNLCSNMPRFGDAGILTTAQIKDVMALLLDPASPVNK
jgi:L-cysteine S-thiosulfotransferase